MEATNNGSKKANALLQKLLYGIAVFLMATIITTCITCLTYLFDISFENRQRITALETSMFTLDANSAIIFSNTQRIIKLETILENLVENQKDMIANQKDMIINLNGINREIMELQK